MERSVKRRSVPPGPGLWINGLRVRVRAYTGISEGLGTSGTQAIGVESNGLLGEITYFKKPIFFNGLAPLALNLREKRQQSRIGEIFEKKR
jgi:hypothetical protein